MSKTKRICAAALLAMGLFAGSLPAVAESAAYQIDPNHTGLYFQISHAGYSNLFGRFNKMSGSVVFDPDDVASGKLEMTIDAESVDTNHQARDDHLRSPDFFNTGEFPEITFTSTAIEVTGEKTGTITGDFTLLGVTKAVTMDVTFNQIAPYSFVEGQTRVGFSATGTLNRADFGMTYGSDSIGDEIKLYVEVEAIR